MAWTGTLFCLLTFPCIFGRKFSWEPINNGEVALWEETKSNYWVAYDNASTCYPDVTLRQRLDFKQSHPKPVGLLTYENGAPVEIRKQVGINNDIYKFDYYFDVQSHMDGSNLPLRNTQQKGFSVWGHFQVTHDVSKYTSADVFNGIGKKTKLLARFSLDQLQGTDLRRNLKGFSVKLYTNEGILDILNIFSPIFAFRDPSHFVDFLNVNARRNPKTNVFDYNAVFDLVLLRPEALRLVLFFFSDYGIPKGWRHTDFFPIHTYELINEKGDRYFVKFNWRTEQGFDFIKDEDIPRYNDPDYYLRDMYNAVENGTYPSWRLDMDVLSFNDIQTVDYNPFDMTIAWKNGTYHTQTIGRLVVDKLPENQFKDSEQVGFNPAHLVRGIPGPIDYIFIGRRFAYRNAINYRLGRNHHNIGVNSADYVKRYSRDSHAPVLDNGGDSPNYSPNSFNGPLPFVDDSIQGIDLQVLGSNAVDLQPAADLYNIMLNEDGRQRMAQSTADALATCIDSVQKRFIKLLYLVSPEFAARTENALKTSLNLQTRLL